MMVPVEVSSAMDVGSPGATVKFERAVPEGLALGAR